MVLPVAVLWVYSRGEQGDIEVYATSKEEVIATLREFGFIAIDESRIEQAPDRSTQTVDSCEW
jgi:hypothetical protein